MNYKIFELLPSFDQTFLKYNNQICNCSKQNCSQKAFCIICGQTVCLNSNSLNMNNSYEALSHANSHEGVTYFFFLYACKMICVCANNNVNIPNIYTNESGEEYCYFLIRKMIIKSTEASHYYLNYMEMELLKENILRSRIKMSYLKYVLQKGAIEFPFY